MMQDEKVWGSAEVLQINTENTLSNEMQHQIIVWTSADSVLFIYKMFYIADYYWKYASYEQIHFKAASKRLINKCIKDRSYKYPPYAK